MKIDKEQDNILRQIAARIPLINVHSVEKHWLKGSEILEWETITEIEGKPIIPEKIYVWNYPVITMMNHYRRLKKIWFTHDTDKTKAMEAVLRYMTYIGNVIKRSKEEKEKSE